jgi:serine/threonine-protein kinase
MSAKAVERWDPEATVVAGIGGSWLAVEGEAEEVDELDLSDVEEVEDLADELVGTVLGSYRLLDLLGEGGMGKVYLGEHVKIGRKVAIKLLRRQYASRHDIVTRFFQEARAVNQIRHENIVDITDFVESDGGHAYLVMELLTGFDLGDLIRRQGPLPLSRSLGVLIQMCDGLAAAHEVGIVHRDLKPDNVFLVEKSGRMDFVKLVDFGVAKLIGDAMAADYGAGGVIGTPAYMSPEQAAGKLDVDHRADVYAMGAIMYRLFTGRPPFRGKTIEEYAQKHMSEVPIPPNQVEDLREGVPPELEVAILKCLAKTPDERFQTMYELRAVLAEVEKRYCRVDGAEALAGLPAARGGGGRTALLALAAAVLLGVAGTVAFFVWSDRTDTASAMAVSTRPVAKPEAPAPEPETAAPLTAAPRTESRITFRSEPAGASVWRADADGGPPLGVTDFTTAFPLGDEEVEFVFRLRGYKEGRAKVSLADDATLDVGALEKAAGVAGKKGAAAAGAPATTAAPYHPKKLDVHETIDPFK